VHQRAAGGQHRVEDEHVAVDQRLRQRGHVRLRLERLLVARQADEAHLRLRQHPVRGVGHAEARPEHRHDQRRRGQPVAGRRGHRRGDRLLGDGEVARGLIDEHLRELAQRRAEGGVVGPLVAHAGEARSGQRVVDDGQLHARHRSGPPQRGCTFG
jgi:hypothetical protein